MSLVDRLLSLILGVPKRPYRSSFDEGTGAPEPDVVWINAWKYDR